ncbi:MAG: winged helix-turn-helix domain-containing protein [Desulfobacteraceae bacterium]|nr:winged helix-turn-helix domain-containing protein [Desulfobacteraceae bacterium]
MRITKKEARQFLLRYQNLWPPRQLDAKRDIEDLIQRLGCIQYDPLNKAGRNADLVLQSRCRGYREEDLSGLLYNERKLVDGWDKNMAIWHVDDWPFFKRRRQHAVNHYAGRKDELDHAWQLILTTIEKKGPISSIDLKLEEKIDWSWAPTNLSRAGLESLYHMGRLIVHSKKGTRKIYDRIEKHLPGHLLSQADPNQEDAAYFDWYVKRRIGSVGLLWNKPGDAWLGIRDFNSDIRNRAVDRLVAENQLAPITIDGVAATFYTHPGNENLFNGHKGKKGAALIAPLDNLLWDRKLVSELFDFMYKWEVYTPRAQRKYGYYVLPVLFGDTFVARVEPVMDRKTHTLVIHNWWWEDDVKFTKGLFHELTRCFREFMKFCGADTLVVDPGANRYKMEWLQEITG